MSTRHHHLCRLQCSEKASTTTQAGAVEWVQKICLLANVLPALDYYFVLEPYRLHVRVLHESQQKRAASVDVFFTHFSSGASQEMEEAMDQLQQQTQDVDDETSSLPAELKQGAR